MVIFYKPNRKKAETFPEEFLLLFLRFQQGFKRKFRGSDGQIGIRLKKGPGRGPCCLSYLEEEELLSSLSMYRKMLMKSMYRTVAK